MNNRSKPTLHSIPYYCVSYGLAHREPKTIDLPAVRKGSQVQVLRPPQTASCNRSIELRFPGESQFPWQHHHYRHFSTRLHYSGQVLKTRLRANLLAALETATLQHSTTFTGSHSHSESVGVLSIPRLGLECSLSILSQLAVSLACPPLRRQTLDAPRASCCFVIRRDYSTGFPLRHPGETFLPCRYQHY